MVFYGILMFAPEAIGEFSGRVFYVWYSVFNLFVNMVFWALMADRFSLEQSKRLFPTIAVGGTLGAIVGPLLASLIAEPFGTSSLVPVSVLFLVLAVGAAWVVATLQPEREKGLAGAEDEIRAAMDNRAIIGGSAWEGVRAVAKSPYLIGISGYLLIVAIMATFLYFTGLQMVAELGDDVDMRTAVFARINLAGQVATLVLQLLIAGQVIKRLGVSFAMALYPIVIALGFIGLMVVGSLLALTIVQATFNATQRAIMRPARETLFTVVGREDKYKAKAFIDTFLYRVGDVTGAFTEGMLTGLGMGLVALVSVVVPASFGMAFLGVWLGRVQRKKAAAGIDTTTRKHAARHG
jgi:AAA family ATP:ADP antiporter